MFREFATWLEATSFSVAIQSTSWAIPLLQSIHILMIGIVFVSILMLALRVMGLIFADQALGEVLNRFSPWISSGLVVMVVTGVLLVIGEPVREFMSLSFWLKMGLLVVGIVSALAFRRSVAVATARPASSTTGRFGAIATVMLWLAIIFLGRAIAYDVEVWGSLSLATRA
jgi:uncharacterized membrane protein SirB2